MNGTLPHPHNLPPLRYGPDAQRLLPFRVPAGDPAREEIMQQGVPQVLRGGDDRLGTLDRIVDGVRARRRWLVARGGAGTRTRIC